MPLAVALAVLLLGVCGCSRGHKKSARSPLDRIQAGRDVSFGQYIVRVAKRQGTTVEGVRVVSRERDGRTATITATKGTLSPGPAASCLTLVLQDAQIQKFKQKASVGQLSLDLPVMGR